MRRLSPLMSFDLAAVFSMPDSSSPLSRDAIFCSIFLSTEPGLRPLQRSEQYLMTLAFASFCCAFFESTM